MSIKITNSAIEPELDYKYLFLDELKLEQAKNIDNADIPKYKLTLRYRMYAIDQDNKRHYKLKVTTLSIDDYLALAMEKAHAGDTDLLQAAGAIELALAQIIADLTELGPATVVN